MFIILAPIQSKSETEAQPKNNNNKMLFENILEWTVWLNFNDIQYVSLFHADSLHILIHNTTSVQHTIIDILLLAKPICLFFCFAVSYWFHFNVWICPHAFRSRKRTLFRSFFFVTSDIYSRPFYLFAEAFILFIEQKIVTIDANVSSGRASQKGNTDDEMRFKRSNKKKKNCENSGKNKIRARIRIYE